MATPITKFKNNATLARALVDESPQLLHARPFNQYDPDRSRWWLIPSSEWPAYKHSKLCVRMWSEQEMHVGFFAEKGFDKSVKSMPSMAPSGIMLVDWYWHEFVSTARQNVFDSVGQTMATQTGLPTVVIVDSYAVNPSGPGATGTPEESLRFSLMPGAKKLETLNAATKTLAALNHCKSIGEISNILQDEKDFRFYWSDVYLGVRLSYGSESTGELGAREIWNKFLAPWNAFLK